MCDSPLQSALAAVAGGGLGGGLGVVAGLGPAETAVLAGGVAAAADLGVHLARGDPAVEPLAAVLPTDRF